MFKRRRRSSNTVHSHSASRGSSERRGSRGRGDEEKHGQKRESEWFLDDIEDDGISPGWRPSEPDGSGFEFTVRPVYEQAKANAQINFAGGNRVEERSR